MADCSAGNPYADARENCVIYASLQGGGDDSASRGRLIFNGVYPSNVARRMVGHGTIGLLSELSAATPPRNLTRRLENG